ncbi:MAG: TonB-dependent siderophore receptor [Oxalicibacterium faecigallinarum]|uniref:TonB-dependent siderophore receptor n=1 Tax=Oxalicibacterium faecigallinarum TaxID=573741 RepID=UPI002808E72B|nr:TonB-dependent siderophore receptor [Oxalicibacterium faecigallinarum]MDQ7970595.1 TonB-dependent siderophore receptor [Oxalicibacterium faecigallinarum]
MASCQLHVFPSSFRPSIMYRAVRSALLSLVVVLPVHLAMAADAEQQAKEEAVLPAVTATAARTTTTEGSHSYGGKANSSSTGLTLSQRDTPQSVSIVTRQQLDDQNIQTIDQLLNITTGVSSSQTDVGARSTYRTRGFDITTYRVDGMEISGGSDFSGMGSGINMDLYDHVEVVRGANGLMGGTGDPSATINLTRKRPTAQRSISGGVRFGSWNNKHLDIDANLPLSEDGSVRSRFVISSDDGDTFRDREHVSNLGMLGIVEADLTSSTTVSAGVQHEKSRTDGASWGANVPIWYADGTRTNLPRSFNPAANWSYTDRETTTLFANLEHRFANRWKANLAVAHTEGEAINNFGVVKVNQQGAWGGFFNQDGTGGFLNGIHSESESERNSVSASLSGPFQLFGREQELMVGLNGYRAEETAYTFSSNLGNCSINGVTTFQGGNSCQYRLGLPIDNVFTWDGNYANFETYRTNARAETTTQNIGLYTAARFNITDDLKTIVGARLSRYKTYTDTYTIANVGSRSAIRSHEVVTPYVGVIYDLNNQYSVYASYTDLFSPQNYRDRNDAFLKPVTGSSYEAGIKGELLDGALNVSAAVFQSRQDNVAIQDVGYTVPSTGGNAYVAASSGVEAKGLELEVSGNLTKNWTGMVGYTLLSVDNTDSVTRDPRHVLRMQTSYRLPGEWNRLTIGGGASYQSYSIWSANPGRPLGGNTFDSSPLRTGGYALFNAMARYQINDNLVATFNVSNLFDKTYYRQFGFYDGLIYGEPRRISLGLRASF